MKRKSFKNNEFSSHFLVEIGISSQTANLKQRGSI